MVNLDEWWSLKVEKPVSPPKKKKAIVKAAPAGRPKVDKEKPKVDKEKVKPRTTKTAKEHQADYKIFAFGKKT